jgi:hypothetical protein
MTLSYPSWYPTWAQPNCANISTLSFVSGAGLVVTGLDMVVPPMVAGVGADIYCKREFKPDRNTAMALAAGHLGGMVAGMVLYR